MFNHLKMAVYSKSATLCFSSDYHQQSAPRYPVPSPYLPVILSYYIPDVYTLFLRENVEVCVITTDPPRLPPCPGEQISLALYQYHHHHQQLFHKHCNLKRMNKN